MRIVRLSQTITATDIANAPIYAQFQQIILENKVTWKPAANDWVQINQGVYTRSFYGYPKVEGIFIKKNYDWILKFILVKSQSRADCRLFYTGGRREANLQKALVASFGVPVDDANLKLFAQQYFAIDLLTLEEIAKNREDKMGGSKTVRLTRKRDRKRFMTFAKSFTITAEAPPVKSILNPNPISNYKIRYSTCNLENGACEGPFPLPEDTGDLNREQAMTLLDQVVQRVKINKFFVDQTNSSYIPKEANVQNWDFELNAWKKPAVTPPVKPVNKPITTPPTSATLPKNNAPQKKKLTNKASGKEQYRVAQNFDGFYSGNVPDYATNYLGTSSVEASQVEGAFGKAHEAINLVNRFDSSLLTNISFLFNFAKSGAYGVYLSALDRAIKTKALKQKLEQNGYDIKNTGEGLTAFPKKDQNKAPEQIQQDIEKLYKDLQSKGGTAIGINVNAVLNAAKADMAESNFEDPDAWQWIAVLHLGGTIAHEAIHAKGAQDEGPSEQIEQRFMQWALPIINEEYKKEMEAKGKEFNPLTITNRQRHAQGNRWYKTAQLNGYYLPQTFTNPAIGSDLQGRFPSGMQSNQGRAPWSMMAQESQGVPIEKRLGRQFMSPLPPDLSQEHDSIEEQLRKYTRPDMKLDSKATMTELLSEGYDEDRGYTLIENLLDEKRPKPLMVPIKPIKKAASLNKIATLFGWMNNLSISDGSTIPGLGDRVMAWDDRDEDFAGDAEDIKKQPRYNPTYDEQGFYYQWIEPRFKPELFNDMTKDYSNTHPAKRFASKMDESVAKIMFVLSKAKSMIEGKEICCTRFLITEDLMPLIDRVFMGDGMRINVFFVDVRNEEDIFAVWICSDEVSDGEVEKAEKYLQKKSEEKADDLIEKLFGIKKQKDQAISEVSETTKDICNDCKVQIIPKASGNVLEFKGGSYDQAIKIGSLAAERLGIINPSIDNQSVSFNYQNIGVRYASSNYAS